MSQGGDGLHLDGVALLQGMVKDSGRVDDLPAQILVVGVADVQRPDVGVKLLFVFVVAKISWSVFPYKIFSPRYDINQHSILQNDTK